MALDPRRMSLGPNGASLTDQLRQSRDLPMNGAVSGGFGSGGPLSRQAMFGGGGYSGGGVGAAANTRSAAEMLGTPYRDLGKTNIALQPGGPPPRGPVIGGGLAPRQGLVEGILSGLTSQFTGALPGFVRDPLIQATGMVGQALDVPVELLGHTPLPWVPDTRQAFERLPETDEMQQIRELAVTDPDTGLRYMAQYIRNHEQEYMEALEMPRIFAPFLMPDSNIVERLLGVPGIPQQLIARTYAGFDERNLEETVLNADPASLPAPLRDIARRAKLHPDDPEALTRDQVLDEITQAGFAFTNDPFVNFFLSVASDPLIVMGFGTGLAARTIQAGALASRTANALSRFRSLSAAHDAQYAGVAARVVERMTNDIKRVAPQLDDTAIANRLAKKGVDADINRQIRDELASAPGFQEALDAATRAMPRRQRSLIALEPTIKAAARISHVINEPFSVFGKDRIAGSMQALRSDRHMRAMAETYDPGNVRRVFDAAGQEMGVYDEMTKSWATWGANSEMGLVHARSLVRGIQSRGGLQKGLDAATPNQRIMESSVISPDVMTTESMRQLRRTMPQYVFESLGMDDAARTTTRKAWREGQESLAARRLAYASGMSLDRATAMMKGADDKMLALAEGLAYGKAIRQTLDARTKDAASLRAQIESATKKGDTAGVEKLNEQLARVSRYTLVGARELTTADAQRLLDIARSNATDAAARLRDAINQYDILHQNFEPTLAKNRSLLDDDILKSTLGTYLDDVLGEGENRINSSLVSVITPDKLPTNLRSVVDESIATNGADNAYRIGLAPELKDQWRVTVDNEGKLVGAAPWVDYVSEMPPSFVPTRLDEVRTKLFSPIRGERLLFESRSKFILNAVEDGPWHISRGDAGRLFDAVRRAASERGIQPRGLTTSEIQGVVDSVHIDDLTKQKLGNDGLMLLTAQAFEGDVMTMGIAPKISGKLKTRAAGWNNYVGVIAERVYPMVRFGANVLFQMQEWTEPYFFNIIRGVKPGMQWNQLDRQTLAMLDRWNLGTMFNDQAEYAYMSAQGWANTTAPGRFGPNGAISVANEKRMKLREVKDRKLLNYIREVRHDGGENFKRTVLASSPQTWAELTAHYGTANAGEIAVRYWIEKGIFHPDDPHYATFMAGATRPMTLGKPARINMTMLARHFELGTHENLRKAIDAGTLTEQRFRDDATLATWDKDYVDRAWAMASSASPDAFFAEMHSHFRRAGRTQHEADVAVMVARGLATAHATAKDMSLHEFLATEYTGKAVWLDSAKDLPARAYTQTVRSMVDELKLARPDRNIEPVRRGTAKFQRVGDRVTALMPKPPAERQNQLRLAKEKADTDGRQRVSAQVIELPGGQRVLAGRHEPQTVLDHIEETMGTGESITNAADWAAEIVDYYGAIAQLLTDDEVAALRASMPDLPDALTDVREEMTARLIMAFAGTQQRTAPIIGMQQVADMLDEMIRGTRAGESVPTSVAPDPTTVGLGTTPIPPGMVRVYHYTGAPEEVLAQGLKVSAAKGETYGEPNVLWASAEQFKPGLNGKAVLEMHLYPHELSIGRTARMGTQEGIDSFNEGTSNVTLSINEVPPDRFVAFATPQTEGYQYFVKQYGRTPTPEVVERVRGMIDRSPESLKNAEPKFKGYQQWLDEYDAGTLAPEATKLTVHGKTHLGIERLVRVMREWESVADKGMGFKLYDFFDQMFDRTTRTLDPTDGLQPGAMDVWLHRGLGYVSPSWVNSVAKRMVKTGAHETLEEAKAALLKQLGIEDASTLRELTDSEYESSLRQVNELVAHANSRPGGWQGKTNWTVGQMQAVLWDYGQTVLDTKAEEVGTLGRMQSRSVAFEVAPSQTSMPMEWLPPTGAETHASRQPVWNDMTLTQRANVTYDVARAMIPIIEDLTGAKVIDRPAYAHGAWRTNEGMSLSPNTTWTLHGTTEQIDDAMDAIGYLLQQDEVFATQNVAGATTASPGQGRHWSYDVRPLDPKHADPALMGALGEYLADAFPDMYGYMTARNLDGAQLLRSVWMPEKGPQSQLRHFEKGFAPRPDWNVEQELMNGTWTRRITAKEYAGFSRIDVPMVSERTVVQVKQSRNRREGYPDGSTFEHQRGLARQAVDSGVSTAEEAYGRELGGPYLEAIRARGRTELADKLVGRYRDEVKGYVDDAHEQTALDSRGHRGGQRRAADLGKGGSTVLQQRGPRGVRGAVAYDGSTKSTLYILKDADASTGVHELFHVFSRSVDPSGKEALLRAYADIHGLKKVPDVADWGVHHEEWAAREFENYVAGGAKAAPTPALRAIFNAFGDWAKHAIKGGPTAVDPRVSAVFDGFFAVTDPAEARATFDLDQFRLVQAIEDGFANGEESAHTNHYYKRGRSWTERSVNHPYLGMYPASYMWGKVLPNMVRFMVQKPFGIDAPLAGAQLVKHVAFYTQLMIETNPDLQEFFEDHPQAVRFLALMVPGTPWDIPVNVPAWARHLAEDDRQNALRAERGLKPQQTDYGKIVTDTVNYAFGTGRSLSQPLDILGEFNLEQEKEPNDAAAIWSQLGQ